jgi:anti-sigma B factor antagonist
VRLYAHPVDLTITTSVDARNRGIITAVGSLDIATRDALLEAGRAILDNSVLNGLVLDLAGVGFIDSSGIGVIVEIAGDATDLERSFAIANPSERVTRILEVTGLLREWTIEN